MSRPDALVPDALVPDAEARFACTTCGRCCESPWLVLANTPKKEEIAARPWHELGMDGESLFEPGPGDTWALKKHPGTHRCILLGPDNLCVLHGKWGEDSKPLMCRRFPYVHVASDEHVWVTANYGCKAVSEQKGPSIATQTASMEAVFERDIGEADPAADTLYPVRPGVDLSTEQLDAALDALDSRLPPDDLFASMRQLAAFASTAPEPGEPEPAAHRSPVQAPGPVRYAFALMLYSDLLDQRRFVDRLRGVVVLPQALRFSLRYTSRLLEQPVDMRAIAEHPGHLPQKSHALLGTWLRSRLRSRLVFKGAPTAAAGLTRALLHVDGVIFFARALAAGREISHQDVLMGLRQVELFIANQQVVQTLSRLDPRLPRFWEDPAVARGAAQLFTPAP